MSGVGTLVVSGLSQGWAVEAIRVSGVDVAHELTDFEVADSRPIEIVVTNQPTAIAGYVTDTDNQRLSDYTVVVFPENRHRWGPQSTLVRTAQRSRGQSYLLTGLPPGNYLAIAVEGLPYSAWREPDILDLLRVQATRVHLSHGETQTLGLRLSTLPLSLLPY